MPVRELFAELPITRGHGRGSWPPGFGVSIAGHGLVLAVASLAVVLQPTLLPDLARSQGILVYDPPAAPPPLPVHLGRGTLATPRRQPHTLPADADALVTPAEPAPDEPAAPSPELDPGGSPTGSESGSSQGLEGGQEDGMDGGLPGGTPGGTPGGVPGGTGVAPVTDYDRPPRPVHMTQPVYPQDAFVKKVEGTVEVEIVIDAGGTVVEARVVRSVPLLDSAALATVREWRFLPALRRGQPVAARAFAPITFRIR